MVYSKWPEYRQDDPETASKYPDIIPKYPSWLNETSVDDLFEFGERYGRRHPVFQKLPIPYNSIVNVTGSFIDSIYVLITSPDSTYMLCSMRATLAADCSTVYDASMSGGHMNARCGDDMAYASPDPRNGVVSKDWANVATDWALSLALNTGISDANSSNARLLAQLIPTTPSLNATLPSIAEALAVLSGCTLLQSTIDAPFTSTSTYLDETIMHQNRQYQRFEAKVRTQDYSSGSSKPWQNAFFVILGPTFAINLICLSYLAVKSTITDFMEPQNMFALSLNSQRSQELNNASGEGPKGKQFATNWFIKWNTDTEHLSIESERASPTDIYTPEIVVEDDKESAWRRASGHAPRVGGRPKFPLTKARSLREGE